MGFLLFWAAIIVTVSLFSRSTIGGAKFSLLRILFPSWRFFDQVGHVPKLYYRVRDDEGIFGAWTPVFQSRRRGLISFVYNPEGNQRLAEHTAVELMVREAGEFRDRLAKAQTDGELAETAAYRVVVRLVREHIERRESRSLTSAQMFQFKVNMCSYVAVGGGRLSEIDAVIVSREHRGGA